MDNNSNFISTDRKPEIKKIFKGISDFIFKSLWNKNNLFNF